MDARVCREMKHENRIPGINNCNKGLMRMAGCQVLVMIILNDMGFTLFVSIASAASRMTRSLISQPKRVQLFQPIGGVKARLPNFCPKIEEATQRLRDGHLIFPSLLVTEGLGGVPFKQQHQPVTLTVSRVVNNIHFAPKYSSKLLWVADAVAFGYRRYYSEQSHGLDFGRAIAGPALVPLPLVVMA